jgi:transcriptional regulator with XRE-family HTH domain
MDAKAIGNRLREEREKRNWSRDHAGAASGLHANTVRNVEMGSDSMQLSTLAALAQVYGVELPELVALGEMHKPKRVTATSRHGRRKAADG